MQENGRNHVAYRQQPGVRGNGRVPLSNRARCSTALSGGFGCLPGMTANKSQFLRVRDITNGMAGQDVLAAWQLRSVAGVLEFIKPATAVSVGHGRPSTTSPAREGRGRAIALAPYAVRSICVPFFCRPHAAAVPEVFP